MLVVAGITIIGLTLDAYFMLIPGFILSWLLLRRMDKNLDKLARYSRTFDLLLREFRAAEESKEEEKKTKKEDGKKKTGKI